MIDYKVSLTLLWHIWNLIIPSWKIWHCSKVQGTNYHLLVSSKLPCSRGLHVWPILFELEIWALASFETFHTSQVKYKLLFAANSTDYLIHLIWVASWQNNCAPSEDSDQTGHPPSLIRVFAVRMKKAWVLSYPLNAQGSLWSEWMDAQADLSLCWMHRLFC